MSEPWTAEEIIEYDRLFKTCQNFVGQKIEQITFYLDDYDIDYNEQPNEYGKSLFYAIELNISGQTYCLGNLFFGKSYNGLNILSGQTIDHEYVVDKKPVSYPSEIIGEQIIKTIIYWTKSIWGNYFVPQEIEFRTTENFLLCSAIEVNGGEVNTPLTDELLIVEKDFCLKKFQLGEYGIAINHRYVFNNLEELMKAEKNIH
jgi:hypothetical protein